MALFMLCFAAVVYGVGVHWATVPLVPPVALLGALAFSAFGMLMVAAVITIKQSMAGATWVVAGISLIAGLYFPVSLLPSWIRWMSHVQPFTPAVDLLRHLLVGSRLASPAGEDLIKLIAFSVVLVPLSVYALALAVRFARRRGTLTEY
jgi:ABC-2 type transport system permease protein